MPGLTSAERELLKTEFEEFIPQIANELVGEIKRERVSFCDTKNAYTDKYIQKSEMPNRNMTSGNLVTRYDKKYNSRVVQRSEYSFDDDRLMTAMYLYRDILFNALRHEVDTLLGGSVSFSLECSSSDYVARKGSVTNLGRGDRPGVHTEWKVKYGKFNLELL